MRNPTHIQIFEYQKLRYSDTEAFKKHHFNAMVRFNEIHQNKYFTIIHKGIRFGSFVGVVQVGGLTIEILPKADKSDNPDKNLWQRVLLQMLQVCKRIQVDTVSETHLHKRYRSILDVYFELYLQEVEKLVKRGLIRKYQKFQSNQNALRGKLLFSQNIRHNIVRKERFYCEHQVYDKNHLLHQILYSGLLVLKSLVSAHLKDRLNRLIMEFQDFENSAIHKKDFDRIVFDRKNRDYEKACEIAKILILNYSPALTSGNENMLALLFDMNVLWEEYIFRTLHKHKPSGVSVSFQNSDKFWEHKSIRPDIVLTTAEQTFVIDTKWKIIEAANPSDDDLKQMFVYNLHWNAEKTLLLYPKTFQTDTGFGVFHYADKGNKCKLGFIDITSENGIRNGREVAGEILGKFGLMAAGVRLSASG